MKKVKADSSVVKEDVRCIFCRDMPWHVPAIYFNSVILSTSEIVAIIIDWSAGVFQASRKRI
jgi:hypothetical protein